MKTNRMVLLAMIASAIALPAWAQTAAELLQKGIYTQETAGDLDGAIAIYRQIVNSGNSPRDVAAQAQYRLAQSLLQKGDLANGATEFSNLARNYADYGKLVSSLAAQARTSAVGLPADRELEKRVEVILGRLGAAADSRAANGPEPPEKGMLIQGLGLIDQGEYDRARLVLNTLINRYPNSDYVMRAKIGIIQSWLREGGPTGIAQAKAELNDFNRFYPDLAGAGGRGGRGPGPLAPGGLTALEATIQKLKAAEQTTRASLKDASPEEQAKTIEALSKLETELRARDAELRSGAGGRGGKTPASVVDPALASATFDANSPVTVKGNLFKQAIEVPNGSISLDPMDGTGKRYTFLTAGPAELARQGMTKVSLRLGDQITVNGVLASGGQTLSDGTIPARADTITTTDGRKLFDRTLIKGQFVVQPGETEIRLVMSDGNFITLPIRWRQR